MQEKSEPVFVCVSSIQKKRGRRTDRERERERERVGRKRQRQTEQFPTTQSCETTLLLVVVVSALTGTVVAL